MKPKVALAIVTLALVIIGVASYMRQARNAEREYLFLLARGYSSSTEESKESLRKLAEDKSERATELLIQLAGNQSEAQVEAIQELASRDSLRIGPAIASLLQPHQTLEIRKHATEALQARTCNSDCANSLLHYLERIWKGEMNREDILTPIFFDVDDAKEVKEGFSVEQNEVYAGLYRVLSKNESETIKALQAVYGLDSGTPSTFALHVLIETKAHGACPMLLDDEKILHDVPDINEMQSPKSMVADALKILKCQ